jgi:hypothetical protein
MKDITPSQVLSLMTAKNKGSRKEAQECTLILDIVRDETEHRDFLEWVYRRKKDQIEEKCEACRKDECPYKSIEGFLSCLGGIDYQDLYDKFKLSEV